MGSDNAGNDDGNLRKFIDSLVAPARALDTRRELGMTPLALRLGLADDQLGGHWCSRCEGIWFGCALEVECPCCGNRHG